MRINKRTKKNNHNTKKNKSINPIDTYSSKRLVLSNKESISPILTDHFNQGIKPQPYENFKLELTKLPPLGNGEFGIAYGVHKTNFAPLKTFTAYYVEIFDESMRTIHMHDSDELGYLIEGTLEIFIWESDTVYTKTIINAGGSWFFPKGTLHSLNNVGDVVSKMFVGFNSLNPSNIDIAVMLNGLPKYLKQEYSGSPHSLLKNFKGPLSNYFFCDFPKSELKTKVSKSSPFTFDLINCKPYFESKNLGFIRRVTYKDWPMIKGINLSLGLINLKPSISTDNFWYTNADALYIVYSGKCDIFMTLTNFNKNDENNKTSVEIFDYFFVPCATPHTIKNTSTSEDLNIGVFFSTDCIKSISLGPSLLFFGQAIIQENFITSNFTESEKSQTTPPITNIKNVPQLFKP